ncbi:MAG: hypothetical protein EA394_11040 [Bacteroidia bacterium]|nr:MAG: hypothetical protein EA394_11040 [Bacteroidia bacterium]
MKEEQIITEKRNGPVVLWTISRPKALNALNSRFFSEFNKMLKNLKKDETVRVLMITGEGKAFVAGADIGEMQHMDEAQAQEFSRIGQDAFARLSSLPFPVIAVVNGYALGGGCELAMACDIRIASENAVLGMPEARLGLIPGYGGTQRLPRLVGVGNALFMFFTGENMDAGEALRMGLVQRIFPSENLMEEAFALAKRIEKMGPHALKTVKQLVHEGFQKELGESIRMENERFPSLFSTDGPEGIQAFLEKRKPNWKS